MILFDSHVLFWWLSESASLSGTARHWIARCEAGEITVIISTVTLWELESKRRRGKLPFLRSLREVWPDLEKLPGVEWAVPSLQDWLLAGELDWAHGDPGDRLLAATALNRGISLLTKDRRFHAADSPVKAVW
jgi:PIN domain nuclease of toxin-antitoxin system